MRGACLAQVARGRYPKHRVKEASLAEVALSTKMTFGYYKLPVVVDTERYYTGGAAPVMGVWCPELNDRSSLLTCSTCPRFGGLVRDPEMTRTFLRCRCSDVQVDSESTSKADSGILLRARRLTLDDGHRR